MIFVTAVAAVSIPSSLLPSVATSRPSTVPPTAMLPVVVTVAPSRFALRVPVVTVKLPVEAPVNEPEPTTNLSSLSSNPPPKPFENPILPDQRWRPESQCDTNFARFGLVNETLTTDAASHKHNGLAGAALTLLLSYTTSDPQSPWRRIRVLARQNRIRV